MSGTRDISRIISALGHSVAIIVAVAPPGGKLVIGKDARIPWVVAVVVKKIDKGV